MRRASSARRRRYCLHRWFLLFIALTAELTNAIEIRCVTDWGGGTHAAAAVPVLLPESSINDGYCDCLDTAADETETNACAGVSQWAGNAAAGAAAKQTTTPVRFQCPQQPELQIPVSRVTDGVCDCCDGADEKKAGRHLLCDDDCAAIFAQQAERLAALRQRYEVGSQKRAIALQEFVDFVTETKRQIKQTRHDLQTKQHLLEQATTQFGIAKADYLQKRVDRVKTASLQTVEKMLNYGSLSMDELQWLIVHACQSAGEITEENADNTKTCVPLRLAGLDVGGMWDSGTYKFRRYSSNDDDKITADIADTLYHNSQQEDNNSENIVWNASDLQQKSKNNNKRRRLMRVVAAEEEEDYDAYSDYDDDYMEGDDDYEERAQPKRQSDVGDDDAPQDETKRDELVRLIQQQQFSKSRVALLDKATSVIDLIDKATKEDREKEESEEEDEENKDDKKPDKVEKPVVVVDPMVFPMVKNKLEKKKRLIQRGIDYAVSAKVLLEGVKEASMSSGDEDELKELLYRLAVGTLNHSKLSAVQFYRILVAVIPELQIVEEEQPQDPQTCASSSNYAAIICPPRSIERAGVKVPSASILNQLQSFCASELTKNQPEDGACGVATGSNDNSAREQQQPEIPSDIPDGYYGYYELQPRAEDDLFSEIFRDLGFAATVGEEEASRAKVGEMEKEVERLDDEVANLEKKLKDLEESIGGDNPDKFGPNGELHSLRDECFSVEEGKYEYEVCMFRTASQKDKGSKGGGTNLGRWKEATTETVTTTDHSNNEQEYEQRIWKWENGAKCWNGPQRSATVHVTCGADNKVLSADEPDTCRYQLEMESPIACDDDFRLRHGL